MPQNAHDAARCPLCEGPNACGNLTGGGDSCWCRTVPFSRAVLEQVPASDRNRRCICRTCALGEAGAGEPPVEPG